MNNEINKKVLNSANFTIINSDFITQSSEEQTHNQKSQFEHNSIIEQLESLMKARDNNNLTIQTSGSLKQLKELNRLIIK